MSVETKRYVPVACDRVRGTRTRDDIEIVGWRVQATVAGRRYSMPVPKEPGDLDFFECDVEAREVFEGFFTKVPGADPRMVEVKGFYRQVDAAPPVKPCHWHPERASSNIVRLNGQALYSCRPCMESAKALGAERVK